MAINQLFNIEIISPCININISEYFTRVVHLNFFKLNSLTVVSMPTLCGGDNRYLLNGIC